jgi:hypothetical protein
MKAIALNKGFATVVDDEDYDRLVKYRWRASDCRPNGVVYAIATIARKSVFMHRLILGANPGQYVDHINFDGLDNRRENLRLCTPAQSAQHKRMMVTNSSGYRGVNFNKEHKKYAAEIWVESRRVFLGYFDTAEEASVAYRKAAVVLHKEFTHE